MKERPINLRDWEVRAILDDRKTQLRRVVKPQPDHFHRDIVGKEKPYATEDWNRIIPQLGDDEIPCPYGSPGDRMWVREAWQDYCPIWNGHWCGHGTQEGIERDHTPVYRADNGWISPKRWRPSIHMPRWASRITLEVVSVRVERVQEIGEEDATAEGVAFTKYANASARFHFREIWDSINAARGFGWDANPWVWVVEFRRVAT